MKTRILITGADGQLGSELRDLAKDKSDIYKFSFHNRQSLDLGNPEEIINVLSEFEPDYVINCAGYTKVDLAEEEEELAFKINAIAPRNLADYCNAISAVLIHISTDYVYDIETSTPLVESDELTPQSIYAMSKKTGEDYIATYADRWITFRTSWVYSAYGHNFVKTMLRLGHERDELNIVNDQIGTPTYAKDLAHVIVQAICSIESEGDSTTLLNEIYNFSNEGQTSWDAFAKKIFDLSDIDCKINGISTETFGAKAPRPLWSVMSKEKIVSLLGIEIRNWEEALSECLDRIKSTS